MEKRLVRCLLGAIAGVMAVFHQPIAALAIAFDQGVDVKPILAHAVAMSRGKDSPGGGRVIIDGKVDCVVSKRVVKGPGQLEQVVVEAARKAGVLDRDAGGTVDFENSAVSYRVRVGKTGVTLQLQDLATGLIASSEDMGVSRIGSVKHLQINLASPRGGLLGEKDVKVLHLTCIID